ncbi:MAG: phenylalanine--tRNA ligase subunit alpha [Candidatus Poseidoniia archaeon]|nr:phenylalanine--tRNA ligase subunit alpha [Candidatus Poseidoniia archaeon]MDP7136392.1 phenylalanine--tRNA ligase subunit alpha [Candidatus Poseidoniia archaeon]MDP7243052.1 phenylalanine--tRNA ligase subunit alpha [Candidatus Poseidoniia archaeon]MDP7535785.1 phenylalanine--tRNA ligase subunit alpha [Candidatus Poseidoniia archaeon]MDP7590776.1 phenylalanine--tRNA ligase subunit alpha [Candidatus Poseidoniia archaeon]
MDLSANEQKVLRALAAGELSPAAAAEAAGLGEQEAVSAASWLRTKELTEIEEVATELVGLNEEGRRYAAEGLPERRAIEWLNEHGAATASKLADGPLTANEARIVIGWLKRKQWAWLEKSDDGVMLTPARDDAPEGADEPLLRQLADGAQPVDSLDPQGLKLLQGRQILERSQQVARTLRITEAGRMVLDELSGEELLGEVTPEMLQSGGWREGRFQRYSLETQAEGAAQATLHPLTRFTEEIRGIFLQMGFTEIEGDYVESAFWNMDALFIPQDHPARELQDTLYLDDPKSFLLDDEEAVAAVKAIHETGGDTGSTGWRYDWSREVAQQALLRTHTTVSTIRYLSEHREPPVRVFAVGRVFRREALDATHLPEFTQVEGIIMEEEASFGMLIGVLKEFYRRMGFPDVRVRPAYFPYTEPSMEIEVKFGDRWLELGGSGIFRPEVTAPFGIDTPVLAWGLGLERLAMLRLGLKDIRMLYQSDLEWLKTAR